MIIVANRTLTLTFADRCDYWRQNETVNKTIKCPHPAGRDESCAAWSVAESQPAAGICLQRARPSCLLRTYNGRVAGCPQASQQAVIPQLDAGGVTASCLN